MAVLSLHFSIFPLYEWQRCEHRLLTSWFSWIALVSTRKQISSVLVFFSQIAGTTETGQHFELSRQVLVSEPNTFNWSFESWWCKSAFTFCETKQVTRISAFSSVFTFAAKRGSSPTKICLNSLCDERHIFLCTVFPGRLKGQGPELHPSNGKK